MFAHAHRTHYFYRVLQRSLAFSTVHERIQSVHERMHLVHERMNSVHDRMQSVHQRMLPVHERVSLVHHMILDDHRMLVSLSACMWNAKRLTHYGVREGKK